MKLLVSLLVLLVSACGAFTLPGCAVTGGRAPALQMQYTGYKTYLDVKKEKPKKAAPSRPPPGANRNKASGGRGGVNLNWAAQAWNLLNEMPKSK